MYDTPNHLAHLDGAHANKVNNIRPRLNQVRQRGSSTKVRWSRNQEHDGAAQHSCCIGNGCAL